MLVNLFIEIKGIGLVLQEIFTEETQDTDIASELNGIRIVQLVNFTDIWRQYRQFGEIIGSRQKKEIKQ
jgi:hypothetical protein